MRAWTVTALAIALALGLTSFASSARADCAEPPASCYCRTAAAVIDGHVEAVATDDVSVRVDSVAQSITPSAATPQAGSLVQLTTEDLGYLSAEVGDRIVAAYDSSGQLIARAMIVEADGQVSCDGHRLDPAQTASLMVMEAGACEQAVEQQFGKYECDDSSSWCAVGRGQPNRSGVMPLAYAAALLCCVRRVRRRKRFPD